MSSVSIIAPMAATRAAGQPAVVNKNRTRKMEISKRTNKIRPSMSAECILHLTLDFPYIKLQIFLTQYFRFYCFPRQKRL